MNLRLKIALWLESLRRRNLKSLHPLQQLFWESTLRCNVHCLHCGSDCLSSVETPDMPAEDFLKVIDTEVTPHVDPHRVLIVISGGEPLMRTDLAEVGMALKKRGYPWGMVTNGLALTEQRFRELRAAGLRSITVSLDGLEEDHVWLRQHPLAFEGACRAIRLLAAEPGLTWDVVTCVNQRTIDHLPAIRDMLWSMGVRDWRVFGIDPMGRAAENPELLLTDEQFSDLMEFIAAEREAGRHVSYSCEGYLGDYEGRVRDYLYQCAAGISVASILIDGSISACTSIRGRYYQGNIYRDSFWRVWEEEFKPYRDRSWMRQLEPCKDCKAFSYCEGNGMHLRREDGSLMLCHLQRIEHGKKQKKAVKRLSGWLLLLSFLFHFSFSPAQEITVNRLGETVNSVEGQEFVPVISADGKTLLFCGKHRNDSVGGEDIYISRHTAEGWSPAEPLRELCTKEGNEAPLSLSADGMKMILFKNGKLYMSVKGVEGWKEPELLSDAINISPWQADAMITSDGKALLFAAKKQTSHEWGLSVNIFVSLLNEKGEWGEPIDLGPKINTPLMDRSPVLHPDMKTLYFSSEGHHSSGDLDVFVSTRLREDSWTEWSEPVNLGKSINTEGRECWYKISTDGTTAYFSKQEGENADIYCAELPENVRPKRVATVSGKLTDPHGKPVEAVIKWENLETHENVGQSQTDPADGSFFIVLPEGKNYGYYIDDERYFPISSNIDLRERSETVSVEQHITVASLQQMEEEHIPMPLNNLFFNTNESDLQPASLNELERVAEILSNHPYCVEIGGHTDNIGSDAANQRLSESRAKAVKDYLVSLGIAASRLNVRGYGESKPVADNSTEEGRRTNRRVEIKFIKGTSQK